MIRRSQQIYPVIGFLLFGGVNNDCKFKIDYVRRFRNRNLWNSLPQRTARTANTFILYVDKKFAGERSLELIELLLWAVEADWCQTIGRGALFISEVTIRAQSQLPRPRLVRTVKTTFALIMKRHSSNNSSAKMRQFARRYTAESLAKYETATRWQKDALN